MKKLNEDEIENKYQFDKLFYIKNNNENNMYQI